MTTVKDLHNLSIEERITLWNTLWTSIKRDAEIPVREEEKQILDERYRRFQEDPDSGKPWKQVYQELRDSQ